MMAVCWKFHRLTSPAEPSPISPMQRSAAVLSPEVITDTINSALGNPLAGRMAWSGNSGGYISTVVNLGPNVQRTDDQAAIPPGNGSSRRSWGMADRYDLDRREQPVPSPSVL